MFIGSARFDVDMIYNFNHNNDEIIADRVQIHQAIVNIIRNVMDVLQTYLWIGVV